MSGVRPEWIAGTDFIMVHRGLVAALDGDYEAAMVLDRINYRAGRDGWWVATAEQMQAETCLTEWKLKSAIKTLRTKGFIESERVSAFDPTQQWRVVREESSGPCGMGTSDTGPVREESSDTVKEESSVTSSQNVRTTTGAVPTESTARATGAIVDHLDPERHTSRPIPADWQPRPHYLRWLGHRYPHVNLSESVSRFAAYNFANQSTSKSWEALCSIWVGRDEDRAVAQLHEGTDDLGVPRTQRKTSVVPEAARPGDPDYFVAE